MIKNIKGLKYKPCLQTIAGSWSILKQIFWAIFREKALLNWSHWSNPSLDFIAKIRTYALPLKRVLYFNASLLVQQYPLLKSSENNTGLACCFWWWLVRFPSPDIILKMYLIQVQLLLPNTLNASWVLVLSLRIFSILHCQRLTYVFCRQTTTRSSKKKWSLLPPFTVHILLVLSVPIHSINHPRKNHLYDILVNHWSLWVVHTLTERLIRKAPLIKPYQTSKWSSNVRYKTQCIPITLWPAAQQSIQSIIQFTVCLQS